MTHFKSASFLRFIRGISISVLAAPLAACGGVATQPEFATTAAVSIVVSCDVAVQHADGQWRVNYCTLTLSGGMSGNALIVPGEFTTARETSLKAFGACVNRRTQTEQQPCFVMLED